MVTPPSLSVPGVMFNPLCISSNFTYRHYWWVTQRLNDSHQDILLKRKKKRKEYISFESVEALCSDANQMGKCSRQVPSQRAALPVGKGAQWSHLEITRFLLFSNSGRKGEAHLFLAAWLSCRAWECLCSELYSQGQDAGAAKGWGSPPTNSRPGAGVPFQACCESIPAVFLGCCHCHGCFLQSRWLKLSGHTIPSGNGCLHNWSTEQWAKEVTQLKMVLLFQKSFMWCSTYLNSSKIDLSYTLISITSFFFFVMASYTSWPTVSSKWKTHWETQSHEEN